MQKWQTVGKQGEQFNLNGEEKASLRQTGKCVCEYVSYFLHLVAAVEKSAGRTYC